MSGRSDRGELLRGRRLYLASAKVTVTVKFHVPEEPFAKRRPRFGKGRTYTDPQTVAAEQAVRWYARRAMKGLAYPFAGAVRLDITFRFAIPKDNRDKKRVPGAWHTMRPDKDNLEKLVLDALNKSEADDWPGAWLDDGQVCCGEVRKHWCAPGQEGTSVTIQFLET